MSTFRDKYGAEWNENTTKAGNLTGSLVSDGYGTKAGQVVIAASSHDALLVEADAYADDFITSGGTPPGRASTTVTEKGDNGGLLLILLALFALAKGNRR